MANNTSTIDIKKVNAAGTEIIDEGKKMFNSLENIKNIINQGKKSFDSEGGEEIRKNFNTSAQKFEEFKRFVAKYGEFLQNYSEEQRRLNEEIAKIAQKITKL
ncbi:MAG: hypothetical protein IJE14_01745 [Clostridia bacterium]|nr:hypothetical protein [Clostridia bacterium]